MIDMPTLKYKNKSKRLLWKCLVQSLVSFFLFFQKVPQFFDFQKQLINVKKVIFPNRSSYCVNYLIWRYYFIIVKKTKYDKSHFYSERTNGVL